MNDTKKIQITLSNEVHNKLVEIQKKYKEQGFEISLARILSNYLDLTKDNIFASKD